MLIMARQINQVALATDIAAILEERDPLPRDVGIDINLRIEALRRYRRDKLNDKALARIEKVAASYRQLLNIHVSNHHVDPFETGILLVYAYPERIASARPGNNAQFQLSNGSYAVVAHTDNLAHEPWLAVAHMDARDGQGKIFLAAPLNPKDLAPLVKSQETVVWDTRRGGLIATSDLRIGSIVLQSKPLPTPNPERIAAAVTAAIMKEGKSLLDFSDDVEQWQNRILSLRQWNPQEAWPDVEASALLAAAPEWITPCLQQVRKTEDLKKINLKELLQNWLGWEKQTQLDKLAPERLEVPSGSKIKLIYHANGNSPILAVRLQELFGLIETPRINNQKTPVVLHLLSPGYKPVQVTSDLRSFWSNTYFEVKKELRTRYPKHVWPDDPLKEPAIRGVKKRPQ
jgi:ATP-dependent helicase HrpB